MSFSLSAWLVRLSIRPLSSLSGRHITYQTDEESVRKSKIQNLSDQNVENQCGTEYIVLIHHLYLRFIASCVTSLHSPPSFSLSLALLKPTKYHQVAGAPGRPQRVLQHQRVFSTIFVSTGGDHEGAHSVGRALPKPSGVGDL